MTTISASLRRKNPFKTTSCIALLATSSTVFASGFQVQEQGVKGLGNAYAGGAAYTADAAAVHANPAGLTQLPAQLVVGTHLLRPTSRFNDHNSTNGVGGLPTGRTKSNAGHLAAVPNFFYTRPLSDTLSFGLSSTTPYGLTTEYDKDWIGRYHAIKSELLTFNINAALAYQLNEQLSLGAGISVQYGKATLSNALDFGTLGFLAGAPGATPSNPALDGFTEVSGDDWSLGFNLGMQYQATPSTRFGASYRSKIEHTLEGKSELVIPDFAAALVGPSRTRDATAKATTPASMSISVHHDINPQWAVMADITRTQWTSFKELRIDYANDAFSATPSPTVQPENWKDSNRYALGLTYKYSPKWTLRTGIAYDETPVPSVKFRTPRIPDNDRFWLAFGASYRYSEQLSVDIGYVHIFADDTPMKDTELTTGGLAGVPVGNTLDGEYDASVDILSAQVQWNF